MIRTAGRMNFMLFLLRCLLVLFMMDETKSLSYLSFVTLHFFFVFVFILFFRVDVLLFLHFLFPYQICMRKKREYFVCRSRAWLGVGSLGPKLFLFS